MPSLAVSDDEQDSEQSGEVKAAVKASGKLKYLFIVVLAIVISLGNVLMKWSFLGHIPASVRTGTDLQSMTGGQTRRNAGLKSNSGVLS